MPAFKIVSGYIKNCGCSTRNRNTKYKDLKLVGTKSNNIEILDIIDKKGEKTYYDNSPEWIRSSIEGTLKRLNTDYLDLYQIHYRDEKTPLSEVVETLDELKKKGYIRYYGLSNIHKNDIKLNDNTKELVRIFESLPVKEQIRLMNIVYDYEEQYRKSHT